MNIQTILKTTGLFIAGISASYAEELISGNIFENFEPTRMWQRSDNIGVVPNEMIFTGTPSESGEVLLNGYTKILSPYLFTAKEYSDVFARLEFMLPKDSNSGLYFMGRYEVQIYESYGRRTVKHSDLGGIYERWIEKPADPNQARGYEGIAPLLNAAKAPGEWQTMEVRFRAPRFDANGNKTENARFISVHVNDQLVQENAEVTGPTRTHRLKGEAPTGPIVIQGDHGPIAIRSFIVKPLDEAQ